MRAGHTFEQTGSEAQGSPHGALTGSFVASHNPEITSPLILKSPSMYPSSATNGATPFAWLADSPQMVYAISGLFFRKS